MLPSSDRVNRFYTSQEADGHPDAKRRIVAAKGGQTVGSIVFYPELPSSRYYKLAEIREKMASPGCKRGHVNNELVTGESVRSGLRLRHVVDGLTLKLALSRPPANGLPPNWGPGRNKIPRLPTSRPPNVPSSACRIQEFIVRFQYLAGSPRGKLGLSFAPKSLA
jgi:hypothetical protein